MELKDVMQKRRSIRAYRKGDISRETIMDIIRDAQNAPSWKNSQTPRYHVALSEEAIAKVRACFPQGNYAKTENVGALVVCAFKKTRAGFDREGHPDNEAGEGWGYYDNGLASMCLLLSATEHGLGSLVIGIRDADGLRAALNIPDDELITAVIALGTSDQNPQMPKRKDTQDIVTID